jgi:hypothetical protein
MTTVLIFAGGRFVEEVEYHGEEADLREFLDEEVRKGFAYDWDEARAYEGGPDACNGEPSYVLTK